MKKFFDKKLIGLIIGLVFIVLIVKNIDIHKSIEAIRHIDFIYIILIIPAYFGAFLFRAFRWKTILSENANIKITSFLNALLRGWLINCIVPARGGEIYRAHYFGKKENVSRVTILTSIVLERIFDGIVLFLILLFMTAFIYSSKKFYNVAIIAGVIFTGGFFGLLLISKFCKNNFIREKFFIFLNTTPNFINKIFDKISYFFNSFINGLEVFESPVLILKSLFFSILVWFCEALTILFLIQSFGYAIGISGSLFVLSIIAFVSLIPGGPASLGPLQWGYILALGIFNISQETAFAISIVNQLFVIIFVFLGSLFFMITSNKEKDYTFGS